MILENAVRKSNVHASGLVSLLVTETGATRTTASLSSFCAFALIQKTQKPPQNECTDFIANQWKDRILKVDAGKFSESSHKS